MAATIQTIQDGARYVIISVTGSGAATTQLIDVTAVSPTCTRMRLWEAAYDIAASTTVQLTWDATAPTTIINMSSGPGQSFCFEEFGGIPNNAGAGVTGSVSMTVTGTGPYTLILTFVKSNPKPA